MPKPLENITISAPGFLGMNKQDAGGILPPEWATEAKNLVIDDQGRIGARSGYQYVNANSTTGTVRQIHKYIDGDGNSVYLVAMDNKIYKINGTSLTDVSGTITTPTADNWKFVNFNGKCIGWQASHTPIVMATTGGSFANITAGTGSLPTSASNEVLAAFGRLWVIDGTTLKYSGALDETDWGSPANQFDLATVWLSGMDEGVALAEFNGHLVVFGKRNIIVYNNPWVPTGGGAINTANMTLVESIGGIGCIARDSVQYAGEDIIFLSNTGIRTLGRTIQEKSMPGGDLSRNVRDYLSTYTDGETLANVKSTYSTKGFYILSLPVGGKTFYFNIKRLLEDGSARTTEWDIAPTALYTDDVGTTYMGFANYVATYTGYLDGVASDGTGGSTYDTEYESGWNDLGNSFIKIPKKIAATVYGGTGTITLKWAFDYLDTFNTANITVQTPTTSEYNDAEYNIGEYSGGTVVSKIQAPTSRTGQVIKFGLGYTVNGIKMAVQRLDMQIKIGKKTV